MYKTQDYGYEQLSFTNFNTTCGMQLDHDNEWVKVAARLPLEIMGSIIFGQISGKDWERCKALPDGIRIPDHSDADGSYRPRSG